MRSELSSLVGRTGAANTSITSQQTNQQKTMREIVAVAMVSRYGITVKYCYHNHQLKLFQSRQEWRDADKSSIEMIETCEEGAARAGACWLGSSIIFLESGAKSEKYPRFKPIKLLSKQAQIKTQTADSQSVYLLTTLQVSYL